jgi:hypothetical protein
VIGDQVKQCTRIRDYFQVVLDTSHVSRFTVTIKVLREHRVLILDSICLNASKEGFLKGCRSFIRKLLAIEICIVNYLCISVSNIFFN